jgi:hypothetical protein
MSDDKELLGPLDNIVLRAINEWLLFSYQSTR